MKVIGDILRLATADSCDVNLAMTAVFLGGVWMLGRAVLAAIIVIFHRLLA